MSLIHDYIDDRKARLVRLGARPCLGCAALRKELVERDKVADAHTAAMAAQVRKFENQSATMNGYEGRIEALELVIRGNPAMADAAALAAAEDAEQAAVKAQVPTVLSIIRATCEHFGRSYADIMSLRRDVAHVWPRHVAMYLAKTLTKQSFPEIGRRMGDRDHTTILHGVRKMQTLINEGHPIAKDIAVIRSKFCAP